MADWVAEAAWYVVHLEDVLSDLSATHRYRRDEALALPAGEFFRLAERLVHYPGAVRDLMTHRIDKLERQQPETVGVYQEPIPDVPTAQVQDPSEDEVKAMRDRTRLQRFPTAKFGDHQRKPLGEALAGVSGA